MKVGEVYQIKKGIERNIEFVDIKRASIVSGSIVVFSILLMLLSSFSTILAASPPEDINGEPSPEQEEAQVGINESWNKSKEERNPTLKQSLEDYENSLKFPKSNNDTGLVDYSNIKEHRIERDGCLPIGLTDDKSPLDNDMNTKVGDTIQSSYGKYGSCLGLDGDGDYAIMYSPVPASLNPENALTVEAWIYPTDLQLSCIIDNSYRANEQGKTKGGYVLRMRDTGAIQFWVCDSDENSHSVQSTATVSVDKWWHVAGVYDGYNLRVYINGVCEAITSFDDDIGYGTDQGLYIGAKYYGDGQYFEGRIDEVRISNYARTFHEDLDGDCMADMYEIMRSPFSDQYNSMEHNGRYALLVAPVYDDEEIQYKYDITQMRHNLASWGWDDRDIIFLAPAADHNPSGSDDLTIGEMYNGDWIDGEAYHDNLDGGTGDHVDDAFDALQDGGDFDLRQDDGSYKDYYFSEPQEEDIVFIDFRDHGDDTSPISFCTYDTNYDQEEWAADDIDTELDSIECRYMVVVLDFCYSGGFIDELDDNTNRIVVSSQNDRVSKRYCYLFYGRIRGGSPISEFSVFDDEASMSTPTICDESKWTDLDGDGLIDVKYGGVYKEYQDDGDDIFEPGQDTYVQDQSGQSLVELKYDRTNPYNGNEENSNADGISGVDGSRDRQTETDYIDKFISITEAHYMGDVVSYDRRGTVQTPQIYKGNQIPTQLFL